MADREKVIKSLGLCIEKHQCCMESPEEHCPYEHWLGEYEDSFYECTSMLAKDALALLKEQEAVDPKTGHWIWLQFCANEGVYCSECHTKMFDRYPMKKKLSQFCGHCGAKMDDEVEGR